MRPAILPQLADVDVLVSMGFTRPMAEAGAAASSGAGAGRGPRSHRSQRVAAGTAPGQCLRPRGRHRRIHHGRHDRAHALVRTPRCQPAPGSLGKPMGGRDRRRRRRGRSWRARRSASSALAISARRLPAAPRPSTCRCAPFAGRPRRMRRAACRSSAAPSSSMTFSASADYLAVTLSLSPATRNLLDDRRLRPDEADGVPDQRRAGRDHRRDALYHALASGTHCGRGPRCLVSLSVRRPSRPCRPTQPFHELGNVIMTPHVSGWTEGMLDARAKLIADNIERTARGELPLNDDPAS